MAEGGTQRGELLAGVASEGFWIPCGPASPGWVSPRAVALLGAGAEALAEAGPEGLAPWVDPADRPALERALASAAAEPGSFEMGVQIAGGPRLRVRGRSTPGPGGGPPRLVLAFAAQPDAAGLEPDPMFQLVLDSIPVRVFWKGLDNNYLGCNRSFARDAGLDAPAEIVGKSDFELSWVEQAELYRSDDQRVMRTGEAKLNYEEPQTRPDGTRLWLRTSKVPMRDASGRVTGVLGCYEDITEARRMREQLARTQKLEAIGRLAGGIAHDFNNILTVLLGNIEMLRVDLDPRDQAHALDAIWDSAKRAAGLNRRLLAFSRQDPIAPRRLDLGGVVAESERMLRSLAGEDVELEIHTAPVELPVWADRSQLEQVLLNLVVNARDAIPRGGRIRISTGAVELDAGVAAADGGQPGPHGFLSVEDTGCGIVDEVVDRIFDPFFTTKPVGRGTGLGLSTVHGIVQQAGGHITVASGVGEGTTMTVRLPLAWDAEDTDAAPTEAEVPLAGRETVLVCDDDPALRRVVCRALETHGYTVLEATNTDDALRLAAGHETPIHMLLTDVIMPDRRGPELASQLLARRPATRVLYMSGYTADALEQRAELSERVELLAKPFSTVELLRRVRTVLERPGGGPG